MDKKPKMGRPPLGGSQRFELRLCEKSIEKVRRKQEEAGMSMSATLRQLVERGLKDRRKLIRRIPQRELD